MKRLRNFHVRSVTVAAVLAVIWGSVQMAGSLRPGASCGIVLAQESGPAGWHEFPMEFPYKILGKSSFPSVEEMARIVAQKEVAPVLIFMVSDEEADYYAPKWSADGKSLAYTKADIQLHTSKIVLIEDVAKPKRKIIFDGLDSYDYMFDWSSPTAGNYVFSSTGKRDELNEYVAKIGAEPVQITTGSSLKKQGDLFVSGSEIRLLYEDGDRLKLLELKSPDSPVAQEGRDVDFGGYPAWAPDGLSFAFARQKGEEGGRPVYDLVLRRADRGGIGAARTLFPSRGKTVRNPVWDATGNWIAFYVGELKKTWDLYVVKAAGQSPGKSVAQNVVTDEVFTNCDAAWDPFGRGLFYFTNRHENAGYYPLCYVDVETGREIVIQYDRALSVALDVAAAPSREAPELAFAAVCGMARPIFVMILNHY